MPRVNVPVTQITRTGVVDATPVGGDTVNNHSAANDGNMWIEVVNTGVALHNVSVLFDDLVDGQTVPAKSYSVAAGVTKRIGPFPTRYYGAVLQINVDHVDLDVAAYTLARS